MHNDNEDMPNKQVSIKSSSSSSSSSESLSLSDDDLAGQLQGLTGKDRAFGERFLILDSYL